MSVDDEKRADLLAKATEVAIGDLGIIPSHYQLNVWATRKGLKIVPRTDEYTAGHRSHRAVGAVGVGVRPLASTARSGSER